jgi:O-antigen biosynthesis protein WbqP
MVVNRELKKDSSQKTDQLRLNKRMQKRIFDLVVSLLAFIIFSIPMLLVAIAVWISSPGPILYWSERVGRNNQVFSMPKFRTMRVNTPVLPTHLLSNASAFLTPIGSFLRKSSLDELPQLFCILKGQMSLVGPRPVLCNQQDLIDARTALGVHTLLPGLTGWAQVNGRDELPLDLKVKYDKEYLDQKSFLMDLKILVLTVWKVLRLEDVTH